MELGESMKLDDLEWVQPCGCGGCSDLRAEAKTQKGQFRIKKTGKEYAVQRFTVSGVPLLKGMDGAPAYEPIEESALIALLSE